MSQNISNLQVKSFGQNFYTNVELAGGKLRPNVTLVGTQFGTMPYRESGIYPVFTGGGRPTKRQTRYGDSPVTEGDYTNRKVTRSFFEDGFFIDWQDVEQIAVDLKAPKMSNSLTKFKREEDIIIMQAALGAASGGLLGDTSTPFTTTNVIPVTTGVASGNAGMNYKKFMALKTELAKANVDIEYGAKPVIVMSPQQYYLELYNDDKFINSSYYAFAKGQSGSQVVSFMDCTIVVMNNVPYMTTAGTGAKVAAADFTAAGASVDTDSTDIRACFAFMPDSIMLEIAPEVEAAIAPVITKGNNPYAYVKMGMGAVRMEEAKVWLVPCDQSI
jgi:hypothetical protein